jgi:hypothetical protein
MTVRAVADRAGPAACPVTAPPACRPAVRVPARESGGASRPPWGIKDPRPQAGNASCSPRRCRLRPGSPTPPSPAPHTASIRPAAAGGNISKRHPPHADAAGRDRRGDRRHAAGDRPVTRARRRRLEPHRPRICQRYPVGGPILGDVPNCSPAWPGNARRADHFTSRAPVGHLRAHGPVRGARGTFRCLVRRRRTQDIIYVPGGASADPTTGGWEYDGAVTGRYVDTTAAAGRPHLRAGFAKCPIPKQAKGRLGPAGRLITRPARVADYSSSFAPRNRQ